MNRLPAAWNRISVGIVGLLLVLLGLALLFSQVSVQPVSTWVGNVDSGRIHHAADSEWWTWVLVGISAEVRALYGQLQKNQVLMLRAEELKGDKKNGPGRGKPGFSPGAPPQLFQVTGDVKIVQPGADAKS